MVQPNTDNFIGEVEFAVLDTPYGIFVYDVSRLYEGLNQMEWTDE